MKHLFVPYELALLAKEKGFNEECLSLYGRQFPQLNFDNLHITDYSIFGGDIECKAPIYQQLIDWFREKHNLFVFVVFDQGYFNYGVIRSKERLVFSTNPTKKGGHPYTYYESLNESLIEAFKLI